MRQLIIFRYRNNKDRLMSKASYRAKQSGRLGVVFQVPVPRRKITLKEYRRIRRTRHRESKKLWKKCIDDWSTLCANVVEIDPSDLG